jgi:DNA-binding LacI/PurR family transcriptional regulator
MPKKSRTEDGSGPISLRGLAEYLGLTPGTVSLVINNAPGVNAIPEKTRQRVLAAAKKLNYQPNLFARSLRTRQSSSVGIIVPEPTDGYFPMIMQGVEQALVQAGYFFFLTSHLWRQDLMRQYPRQLMKRSIDGLLLMETPLTENLPVPIVALAAHEVREGVTNIVLNHSEATLLGIKHLYDLGHRRIAFERGSHFTQDVDVRWSGMVEAARNLGLPVLPELCLDFEAAIMASDMGYSLVRDLLKRTHDFTAIFCFNDITAIGAIRALRDFGLRCPEDVSVIGFDDILSATYSVPRLTTIRQPLREMGRTASEVLLRRIRDPKAPYMQEVMLHAELIIRESTGPVRRVS